MHGLSLLCASEFFVRRRTGLLRLGRDLVSQPGKATGATSSFPGHADTDGEQPRRESRATLETTDRTEYSQIDLLDEVLDILGRTNQPVENAVDIVDGFMKQLSFGIRLFLLTTCYQFTGHSEPFSHHAHVRHSRT